VRNRRDKGLALLRSLRREKVEAILRGEVERY
jgi:hypothetical protein